MLQDHSVGVSRDVKNAKFRNRNPTLVVFRSHRSRTTAHAG